MISSATLLKKCRHGVVFFFGKCALAIGITIPILSSCGGGDDGKRSLDAMFYGCDKEYTCLDVAGENSNVGNGVISFGLSFIKTWDENGLKPAFFMQKIQDKILLVTGDGEVYIAKFDQFNLKIRKVESNLVAYLSNSSRSPGRLGIKGLLINDSEVYLSYTREVRPDCYNTSASVGKINNLYLLEFDRLFTYDECASTKGWFNGHKAGGRLYWTW